MNENKEKAQRYLARKKQVRFRIFLLILLSAVLLAGTIFLIIRLTPSKEHISYEEYFGRMEENQAAIVLQDQILEDSRALVSDSGEVYLPHELVRDSLNERFFWDEEGARILFTTALQTFEIPVGSASYTILDGALSDDPASEETYEDVIALRDSSDALYLNMNFVARYTDIACLYDEDTRHVFIRTQWGETPTSSSRKEAAVRYQDNIKSPIIADLEKEEEVTVLEEGDKWLKVLTKDGFIGWVKANRMSKPKAMKLVNEGFTPVEYPSISMDEKVALVWHLITTLDENKSLTEAIEGMTGFNVISPTWFALADNTGNVESIGSKAYVEEAHKNGLQVWGLVNDFSPDMDNSVMLSSTAARRNCIAQLMGYAKTLGVDGINIDYEHIDEGDAYTYTQFIRELSIACRRASLVLSVDSTPPYDFNAYLNRKEIAEVSDYLINMGYDEHYVGGETAGSVASFGFEEGAIANLRIIGVPENKLISAVPFYTRVWYTSTDEAGTVYLNSETLKMSSVSATLESWNLTPSWDPVTSQNYVSWYTDDGVLCEIWIEDSESLRRKALLVPANNLAGIAAWVLGFQDDSVWSAISEAIATPHDEAAALIEQMKNQDKEAAIAQIEKQASTESETGSAQAAA